MTTLHEAAMRLALGALESLQRYDGTLTGAQVATAIESLRSALAQQGEPETWTDDGGWEFPIERQIIQTR